MVTERNTEGEHLIWTSIQLQTVRPKVPVLKKKFCFILPVAVSQILSGKLSILQKMHTQLLMNLV